jgi:hypothetical protein
MILVALVLACGLVLALLLLSIAALIAVGRHQPQPHTRLPQERVTARRRLSSELDAYGRPVITADELEIGYAGVDAVRWTQAAGAFELGHSHRP